jgi:hypothetical protein
MRAIASVGKDEPVRLITRELHGFESADIELALNALVSDGAALLVAGLSPRTAGLAVEVAASHRVAVVLLSQPTKLDNLSPFVFWVESPRAQVQQLFRESLADSRRLVQLTREDAFCRAEEHLGWAPEFLGSRAEVLVEADAACATRLADELKTREAHLKVWLGPTAANAADAFSDVTVITSPQLAETRSSAPVALFRQRFQRLPSWQEALGYDVTRLGIEAIKRGGFESLRGASVVHAARQKIRDQLAVAEGELMTTTERGFRGQPLLRASVVAKRVLAEKASR